MKLFSERAGLKPVKETIQVNSMDADLWNRLWNVLRIHYLRPRGWKVSSNARRLSDCSDEITTLLECIWHRLFKEAIDTIPKNYDLAFERFRERFFLLEWFEVYDLLEFVVRSASECFTNNPVQEFHIDCNEVLEEEMAGYRLVEGKIVPVTDEQEIKSIETAMDSPYEAVNEHLKDALRKLADRTNPDYRNSIKESISAVEAMCQAITDNPTITLGQALQQIEKAGKVEIHRALKDGFRKIYGYTSDADGIRHGFLELDPEKLDSEDARFMLVACSAFINYRQEKVRKSLED